MAIKHAKVNDETNSLYLAKGDFLGLNGNYSAGVLEGVVHYMPDFKKFLLLNDDGISYE